jgi:hypothetical protein
VVINSFCLASTIVSLLGFPSKLENTEKSRSCVRPSSGSVDIHLLLFAQLQQLIQQVLDTTRGTRAANGLCVSYNVYGYRIKLAIAVLHCFVPQKRKEQKILKVVITI